MSKKEFIIEAERRVSRKIWICTPNMFHAALPIKLIKKRYIVFVLLTKNTSTEITIANINKALKFEICLIPFD